MNRRYELKERARRKAETRERIVEATVALHTSIGPARTTISAVAERAGVERHTVYAHFPDDGSLLRACSAHWGARHPTPDFEQLGAIEDPVRGLRGSLGEIGLDRGVPRVHLAERPAETTYRVLDRPELLEVRRRMPRPPVR